VTQKTIYDVCLQTIEATVIKEPSLPTRKYEPTQNTFASLLNRNKNQTTNKSAEYCLCHQSVNIPRLL